MLAPTAQGADPWEFGIDHFLIHSKQGQPHHLPDIQAVHAGDRAASGAGAAGQAQVGILAGQPALFAFRD